MLLCMPEKNVLSSTPRVCSVFTAPWAVTELGGRDRNYIAAVELALKKEY